MSDLQSYLEPNRWMYRQVGPLGKPGPEAQPPQAVEAGAFTAEKGLYWESAAFPSQPLQWYRLAMEARTPEQAYWSAMSYDDSGEIMMPDHYSGVDPSEDWQAYEFRFRGKHDAQAIKLRLHAFRCTSHWRGLQLGLVSRQDVHQWADAIWADMPDLSWQAPADRGRRIARSMDKLASGGQLRMVFLGDSVVNDFGSSPCDVLIEDQYPGAGVQVVTSVSSNGNCQRYLDPENFQSYVLDAEPELLVIGGISHGGEVDPIRQLVRRLHDARPGVEVLLTTPAPMPVVEPGEDPEGKHKAWEGWSEKLADLADDLQAEFLDLTGIAERYIAESGIDPYWLLRDSHHANWRGRQLVARAMERQFAP